MGKIQTKIGTYKNASTQTQALNALAFLYEEVLGKPLDNLKGLLRVQQRHRVAVVWGDNEANKLARLNQHP